MLKALTILGGLFALGLALISIGANFWFGTLLTTGEERWLYGAVFSLLDALKTVLPVMAAGALAVGLRAKALTACVVFAILTTLSFTAEIGLYATTKSEAVGDAAAAHEKYTQAKAAKEKADADLATIGVTRPAGEIEGDVAALKRDRLYDRSKACSVATAAESRELCAHLDRLAGERDRALEAAGLRQAAANASVALSKQDVAAAMRKIDPQAETLAKLFAVAGVAVEPDTVRTGLAVLIALLIELGSGLGPWLAAPSAAPRKSDAKMAPAMAAEARVGPVLELEAVELQPAKPDAGEDLVARWAAASLVKRRGAFVLAAEARASYEAWCAVDGAEPLNATAFGKAMTELGYGRDKVGGRMRYECVALTAAKPALRLAVDNAPDRRVLGRMVTVGRDA
jgi:hypothetical protein